VQISVFPELLDGMAYHLPGIGKTFGDLRQDNRPQPGERLAIPRRIAIHCSYGFVV
jgi:hypothetical protein